MPIANLAAHEADLRELRAMRDSRGWAIVSKVMTDDILAASSALSDNPNMPEAEMRFRLGAIRAARNYTSILDSLIQQFENDVLMASVEADSKNDLNATT